MTAVRLDGLTRRYGSVVALDALDLEIGSGEFLALLGPSGCGKTTALRAIAGFDQPDEGRVLLDERDITGVPASKRDMGMVFQAYSLFPNLTAAENVAFGLRVRRRSAAEQKSRSAELLELVGLADRGNRYPHQLSGGQQQRVALARALAVAPKVLLLARRSAGSSSTSASPPCSSPTTRPRRCRSPTGSGSCGPGGWSRSRRPTSSTTARPPPSSPSSSAR
jgi:ABC-type Fe3+/spermidine/putrescine transport system ATPase subunit